MRNAIAIAAAAALLAVSIPAQAADKVSLRTDWIKSAYHAVWYYAKDKGVFAKNGIDVDIRDGRGSVITAQTVGNKTVTFGTADGGAVMVLVSKGLPVKIVASYLRTNPVAIIFPKKNGWKSWKDLAGSRIGFSAGGATAAYFKALAKKNGIEGKVKLVFMEPAAKLAALLQAKVDAIDSFGFLQAPKATAAGIPSTYFSYASGGIVVPGLALITHNDNIEDNPDLVRRMVASVREALALGQKEPEAAIQSLLKVAPNLKPDISLDILKASFDLFENEASKGKPSGWTPPGDIEKAQKTLIEFKRIKKEHPIDAYFTNDFIPKS